MKWNAIMRSIRYSLLIGIFLATFGSTVQADERVKITWLPWAASQLDFEFADLFMELHPGIEIEVVSSGPGGEHMEKMYVLAATNSLPELFSVSRNFEQTYLMRDAGWMRDLTHFVERDIDLSLYLDGYFLAVQHEGRFYGMPWWREGAALGTWLTAYNRDRFDETGVEYPWDGWTFEDLNQVARRVARGSSDDGPPEVWGLAINDGAVPIWLWSNGTDFLSEDQRRSNLRDPAVTEALEFIIDLRQQGVMAPNNASVITGATAINIGHTAHFYMTARSTHPEANWAFAHMPVGPSGDRSYVLGGSNYISMSPFIDDEKAEAAWAFLRFQMSEEAEEFRMKHDFQPFMIDTVWNPEYRFPDSSPYDMTPLLTQANRMPPTGRGAQRAQAEFVQAFRTAFRLETPLQSALENAHSLINAILDEAWAR